MPAFPPAAAGRGRSRGLSVPASCWPALALLLAAGVFVLFTYDAHGISNDEEVQHVYGRLLLDFYASGFADQRAFEYRNLYLYGGLFDLIAAGLERIAGLEGPAVWNLRHLLSAAFGLAGLAGVWLLARRLAGERAGVVAMLLLLLTGAWSGAMFTHTKDVPFAAAMVWSLYFTVRVLPVLPAPALRDLVGLGVALGCAFGLRIGAVFAVFQLGAGVLAAVALHDGARGRFLLRAVAALAGVRAAPALADAAARRAALPWLPVVLAALCPLAYTVFAAPPLYNGIRHFTFLLPPLAVLAGAGFAAAWQGLARRPAPVRRAALAACAVALLVHATVLVRLHPYGYVAYNSFAGGVSGSVGRWEQDYWASSLREAALALDAFVAREGRAGARHTVAVCAEPLQAEVWLAPGLVVTRNWRIADFFLAPTQMGCDGALQGRVVARVERMGVLLGVVKDRRGLAGEARRPR